MGSPAPTPSPAPRPSPPETPPTPLSNTLGTTPGCPGAGSSLTGVRGLRGDRVLGTVGGQRLRGQRVPQLREGQPPEPPPRRVAVPAGGRDGRVSAPAAPSPTKPPPGPRTPPHLSGPAGSALSSASGVSGAVPGEGRREMAASRDMARAGTERAGTELRRHGTGDDGKEWEGRRDNRREAGVDKRLSPLIL